MAGSGGQSYIERPPVAELAGVVSSVWFQQVAPDAEPYTQRDIPNGAVGLVWRAGAGTRVVGPHSGARVEAMAPGTTIVGVRFHPGAAPSVLGLPASELVDLALDAEDLLGDGALALDESMHAAASPGEALAELQRHLAARLDGAAAPDPLIREAVRQLRWATDDVGSLTSSLSISERQLRRRFQAATGHAPKTLHRMLRFQRFLALAQYAIARGVPPTGDGLARMAAEAGYADQPHLNRECLRLTGATPGAFLGEAEDHCGCGHDHAASYMPVLQARARTVA